MSYARHLELKVEQSSDSALLNGMHSTVMEREANTGQIHTLELKCGKIEKYSVGNGYRAFSGKYGRTLFSLKC